MLGYFIYSESRGKKFNLSVVRKSKSGGQERVAGVDANLHGVLSIDEFEEHVQELSFIGGCCHDVPVSPFQDE